MKRSTFSSNYVITFFLASAILIAIASLVRSSSSISSEPVEPSLAEQAAKIMKLPPEASVTSVQDDEWQEGNGDVEFTLPNTHSPEEWIWIVWKMNSQRRRNKPIEITRHSKDNISLSAYDEDQTMEHLSLDRVGPPPRFARTYSYSAIFDK